MAFSPLSLTPEQERVQRNLLAAFLAENRKLNLSAYRTEETCWVGNILDSVAALSLLLSSTERAERASGEALQRYSEQAPLDAARSAALEESLTISRGLQIIDIGTGGGFPLLPLALLRPDIFFTGVDAITKKITAVERIVSALGITNVRLVTGRAEELGHNPAFREQFAIVTSRAVAPLATLLEYLSPFAKVGGRILCWKSLNIEDELQESLEARMTLRCRLTDRHRYTLPGDWGERQILIFEKTGSLPREFPRTVGIPKKEPL